MIVQERSDSLLLVPQHEHGLMCGELAARWTGLGDTPERLTAAAILGIALHDIGWRELDAEPRYRAETGRPHGFETHPGEGREVLYHDGPPRAHAVHPWAGLLAVEHYARFDPPEATAARMAGWIRDWKQEWGRAGGASWTEAQEARLRRDGAHLRLLDLISLHTCLHRPDSVSLPEWLAPERVGRDPDGRPFRLAWDQAGTGPAALTADPFPWREPFTCRIRARRLETSYPDAGALLEAWNAAPWEYLIVPIRPA